MANENNAENVLPTDLSPEEMAKRRAEITAYYQENIPALTIQLEYETILRDIEKMRAERLQAQAFMTKMQAAPPAPVEAEARPTAPPQVSREKIKEFEAAARKKEAETSKKRTLKKDKKND